MAIKVAYLFGAGASQGEVFYNGGFESILMDDIAFGISKRIIKDNLEELFDANSELMECNADVEHLITLFESAGTKKDSRIANKLKELFRKEIQDRINRLGDSFFPTLFAALIDMHWISGLDEELIALMTINYEDFVERAMQSINGGINYYIKTVNKGSALNISGKTVPILKLHGSFNWKNEYPIAIVDRLDDEEDILWIPPGVVKRREYYPFSVIWSKARELLECDVLRVIGCSLSRNDWELISLLYITQKLRCDCKPYWIELIDYPQRCMEIKNQYAYLQIRPILSLPEFRDYLIQEYKPGTTDTREISQEQVEEWGNYISDEKQNIFALWLQAKGEKLIRSGVSIDTQGGVFKKLVRGSS